VGEVGVVGRLEVGLTPVPTPWLSLASVLVLPLGFWLEFVPMVEVPPVGVSLPIEPEV